MGGGKSAIKPRFQLVEGKFTWEEARKDAIARGGHLATITSQREQQLMENLLSGVKGNNRGVWLGGSNVAGSWEWVTKEQWSYTNWNAHHQMAKLSSSLRDGRCWIRTLGG